MNKTKQQKGKQQKQPEIAAGNASRSLAMFPIVVFLFSAFIYLNTIPNNYNLDDELVTQNHRLTSKGISAIPEIFTSPYYEDKAGYKYEYRPIVLISFAIEHTLFGDNPHVSHFINVALYGLLCMLLFYVLKASFSEHNSLYPLLITIIFAAHPIHTEVVASIKNRDEILAFLFALGSWLLAISFVHRGNFFLLPVILLLFVAGLLSKSTIITFVVIVPVAVILLNKAGYGKTILLTLLLTITALFFARLYSVVQQLVVTCSVLLAVSVIYLLRNNSLSLPTLKSVINSHFQSLNEDNQPEVELSASIARVELFAVFLTITTLFVTSTTGIYSGFKWLTFVPMVLLATGYLLPGSRYKLYIVLPLALLAIASAIRFPQANSLIEVALLFLLGTMFLSDDKRMFHLSIAVYAVYALTSILSFHSFLFLSAFLFVGFRYRKIIFLPMAVLVVLCIVSLFNAYKAFGSGHFNVSDISLVFMAIGIALIWKGFRQKVHLVAALLIPLFVLYYFSVTVPKHNTAITDAVRQSYYKANTTKAVDITPVQSVRPIKYIEFPIENTAPLSVKLGTAMVVLGKYLQLVLLPYPMSFYYGYSYISPTSFLTMGPMVVLAIHLFLLALSFYLIRKDNIMAFGILLYLISISVFSTLTLPIPGMLGDRFLLIPSLGFCIALVTLSAKIFKASFKNDTVSVHSLPKPLVGILTFILIIYSGITLARNGDWKDRLTLFRKDIQVVDKSAQAHNLLGVHLLITSNAETDAGVQKQMREEAVTHFSKAIEIYPPFLNATYDLGRSLELLGRTDEAIVYYNKTAAIDTNFVAPFFNIALYYHNKGELDKAIGYYEKYLAKYTTHKEVYANLSFAYFKKGDFAKSIEVNQRLLQQMPNTYEPTINIAKTYMQTGNLDSAFVYFERSFVLNSTDVNIVNSLLTISERKGWKDKEAFYRQQLVRFQQSSRR